MCGIAGRILSKPGRVGHDLVELMDAQEHRGADSTGFAIYGTPLDEGLVIRGMGFNKSNPTNQQATKQAIVHLATLC